jgi:hypothetical protein
VLENVGAKSIGDGNDNALGLVVVEGLVIM